MRARYPYSLKNVQEFDPDLGDIIHFAAYYEYLFAIVSVLCVSCHVMFTCND